MTVSPPLDSMTVDTTASLFTADPWLTALVSLFVLALLILLGALTAPHLDRGRTLPDMIEPRRRAAAKGRTRRAPPRTRR